MTTTERLACSRCGAEVTRDYEPGPCDVPDESPEDGGGLLDEHDQAEPWGKVNGPDQLTAEELEALAARKNQEFDGEAHLTCSELDALLAAASRERALAERVNVFEALMKSVTGTDAEVAERLAHMAPWQSHDWLASAITLALQQARAKKAEVADGDEG